MEIIERIQNFEELAFGLFVHFGVYSKFGQGEWTELLHKIPKQRYHKYAAKFNVKKDWAKNLVKTAKAAGCKYINITTRHHDGFSLFDTKGLSDYDIMHTVTNRDIIKEFVDECNKGSIVPFFYHTLLDWHNTDYNDNFSKYVDYLIQSVEILCKNYGNIGGFWFDGMWDKPDENWQEDRLYSTIRKYQPNAMIINNTGLSALGQCGHNEIDSVTFERGKPTFVDNLTRPIAGEMCQVLNDHWGYAKDDCNYKSVATLIENLIDCRSYNCNFLLNTGLKGDGKINHMDDCLLKHVGNWVDKNNPFLQDAKCSDIQAENAIIFKGKNCYYAAIKNVPMSADPNVTLDGNLAKVVVKTNKKIKSAMWLDNLQLINIVDNSFFVEPFLYGTSLAVRIAKLLI